MISFHIFTPTCLNQVPTSLFFASSVFAFTAGSEAVFLCLCAAGGLVCRRRAKARKHGRELFFKRRWFQEHDWLSKIGMENHGKSMNIHEKYGCCRELIGMNTNEYNYCISLFRRCYHVV